MPTKSKVGGPKKKGTAKVGQKKTMKISGSTFTKDRCGAVGAIRAAAAAKRKQGLRARVVKKKGGGACLYVGGRSKRKTA